MRTPPADAKLTLRGSQKWDPKTRKQVLDWLRDAAKCIKKDQCANRCTFRFHAYA